MAVLGQPLIYMYGKLYLISTPIGNYDDITLRAIDTLKLCDIICCEEFKPARRFLAHLQVEKKLLQINEHNEKEETPDVVNQLKSGSNIVLISDCGTPLFSDPGNFLVRNCIEAGIEIIPVPGANSLLPALIASGFNLKNFYYFGWLSAKKEIRKIELRRLKGINELIVLMETPYRLLRILEDILKEFGPGMPVSLAYKLTMPEEKIYRGTISEVKRVVEKAGLKGEFVLVIDNRKSGK